MRTLEETITGRNVAFQRLQSKHLRYRAELTRTGSASPQTVNELTRARRIYQTWAAGSDQGRQRRQMAYDAELTRQAQSLPRPWVKAKRKRKRTRKTRPAPQPELLQG